MAMGHGPKNSSIGIGLTPSPFWAMPKVNIIFQWTFPLNVNVRNMFTELSEISSRFGVGLNQSINDETAGCELP